MVAGLKVTHFALQRRWGASYRASSISSPVGGAYERASGYTRGPFSICWLEPNPLHIFSTLEGSKYPRTRTLSRIKHLCFEHYMNAYA